MTTAQNDLTESSGVESDGKDPIVGRTNDLFGEKLISV